MTQFWLGTHDPYWLTRARVPLCVSHHRLRRRPTPRAVAPWILDSGGFTVLHRDGGWTMTADEWADLVAGYAETAGMLAWAAPQDWMCEPSARQATGLTVEEHQARTVANWCALAGRGPFVPVLQGWQRDDYWRCVGMYADAGYDLRDQPLVGLGTVCRRQAGAGVAALVRELAAYGLRLHGFGLKRTGLKAFGRLLTSADSMAWSYRARNDTPMAGCAHASCSNCLRYALRWRAGTLAMLGDAGQLQLPV